MKILVVDDMMSMRHVMMAMLRNIGFDDINEAVDGIQALKLINKQKYDLVITDFYMPNLNGKELLLKIRSQEETKDLPVMMVTCVDDKEQIKSIIASKVTGFVIKPFSTNTIQKQINRMMLSTNKPIT
jgi:two-component system chemotaxis response regulator CheY